jgi:hypothetical protein
LATRKQENEARRKRIEETRAKQRAQERRRRLIWFGGGGAIIAAVVAVIVAVALTSGGSGSTPSASHEVIPAGVTGTTTVEPAALEVTNTSGIQGVVAYDTTGWPTSRNNGPAARALGHQHVAGPVTYSVTPPVGGDHSAEWMNCGIYSQQVPNERAVHNLEHGAVWITYQPSLPASEVTALRNFVMKQSLVTFQGAAGARYMDLTPYPGLPSPIVITSWGFQLRVTSPSDPRLQEFVSKFRASQTYTPEYGGACTGAVGTPLES